MSARPERERLHTAVLVAPAKEKRRLRKQRRQAAAQLAAEQHHREAQAQREKAAAERAEQKATHYLPAAGESGPAAAHTRPMAACNSKKPMGLVT